MKKYIILFWIILCSFVNINGLNYLSTQGNMLYDSNNNPVRLSGVNWFGFETSAKIPHGLWARDFESMLQQIADLGFNCVRIPFSNETISSTDYVNVNIWGPDPYNGQHPMNEALVDKTPLEALDEVIEAAGEIGLKVILDNHSRYSDGYMNEQLWYTDTFSEEQWIADWEFLAERYSNNDTVTGFDLNNEPHGSATWGGPEETNWKLAAESCACAIQAINPDVLIIIEGVESYNNETYWWGGNLAGVSDLPIEITYMEKLVYSPHEYGPEVFHQTWFDDPAFPANMPDIWSSHFGFIMEDNICHSLIGEFGIRDSAASGGLAGIWFEAFIEFIAENYSFTYWCMNPNSGDTGGILQDDWVNVNQWKLDLISPCLAPMIEDNEFNQLGDIDGNGQIEAYDSALILRHVTGLIQLEAHQLLAADVDGNIVIDSYDSSLVLQHYVGIILQFPAE